ncbi:hypothetical protein F5Y16DRAFT_423288 [Xylariaceae sp. FL0255]|nr:hypothetical protein F5Y16DRAFT_423288 [Xylariaceae sp. FL0255]
MGSGTSIPRSSDDHFTPPATKKSRLSSYKQLKTFSDTYFTKPKVKSVPKIDLLKSWIPETQALYHKSQQALDAVFKNLEISTKHAPIVHSKETDHTKVTFLVSEKSLLPREKYSKRFKLYRYRTLEFKPPQKPLPELEALSPNDRNAPSRAPSLTSFQFKSPPKAPEYPIKPLAQDLNDIGPPPPTLKRLKLSETKWRQLEVYSRSTVPRFLFRGFTSYSGGGHDARLNSKDGVIPHGFLNGKKPTNIYDILKLKAMINGHINGDDALETEFSSWAANSLTAGEYADGQSLAILDTSRMESHVRVYHVPALLRAGLSATLYPEEYLLYGPVRGPAFHHIRLQDAVKFGLKTSRLKTQNDCKTMIQCSRAMAIHVGGSDRRPAFIVAITTALVLLFAKARHLSGQIEELLTKELKSQLSEEMRALKFEFGNHTAPDGHHILVNPRTCDKTGTHIKETHVYIRILQQIEQSITGQKRGKKRMAED